MPAALNGAVVMGLVPTKGLTLPFLSYGSNSLICRASRSGILLRIAAREAAPAPSAPRRPAPDAGARRVSAAAARRFAVAGGGTGGHVTPALALAERIAARGDEVLLVGSPRGLETRLVPGRGLRAGDAARRPVMGRGAARARSAARSRSRAACSPRAALLRRRRTSW